MKLTVCKNELSLALARVGGSVDKKTTINPLLSHIHLQANKAGYIGLSATDLMIYTKTDCPAAVEIEGTACIPAEKLIGAIENSGPEITLSLDEQMKLNIDSEAAHFDIVSIDAEDFPKPFENTPEPLFDLGAGVLSDCIKAVEHAICRHESKAYLCGINIRPEKLKNITIAATDGHRLSLIGMEKPETASMDLAGFTVPAKAARILSNICSGVNITNAPSNNLIRFVTSKTDISTRLLEGEYPDYRKVIPPPERLLKSFTANRTELIEALERVCIMAEGIDKSVRLEIHEGQENGRLHLTALSLLGTASASVQTMGDTGIQFNMNSKYLHQALKSLEGDEVFVKCGDEKSPVMIIPCDHGKWDERIEIIMPVGK